LGCGKSFLSYAAARRLARRDKSVDRPPQFRTDFARDPHLPIEKTNLIQGSVIKWTKNRVFLEISPYSLFGFGSLLVLSIALVGLALGVLAYSIRVRRAQIGAHQPLPFMGSKTTQ
jgi:hypothetical protein